MAIPESLAKVFRPFAERVTAWTLNDLRKRRLYPPEIPYEVKMGMQRLLVTPYIELILTRQFDHTTHFIAETRIDPAWNGRVALPGSEITARQAFTGWFGQGLYQEIARKEKLTSALTPVVPSVVGCYLWDVEEHPDGILPLSIFAHVQQITEIEDPGRWKWFSEVPANMVKSQGAFLRSFISYLDTPEGREKRGDWQGFYAIRARNAAK